MLSDSASPKSVIISFFTLLSGRCACIFGKEQAKNPLHFCTRNTSLKISVSLISVSYDNCVNRMKNEYQLFFRWY